MADVSFSISRRRFLLRPLQFLLLWLVTLRSSLGLASSQTAIKQFRYYRYKNYTRVVFEMTHRSNYKIQTLKYPNRMVLDLNHAYIQGFASHQKLDDHLIDALRSGQQGKSNLRIVIDLKNQANPKVFWLSPDKNSNNHRFVIDLYDNQPNNFSKQRVVVIDAGHGGKDPGAIGPKGVREKDIVLSIAKKLANKINKTDNMVAYLTRSKDKYIGLRQRVEFARKKQADLFISIHADAFTKPNVEGSSVFVLSLQGASSEAARLLAARENSVDLIGGIELNKQDTMVAQVLLDLSQTQTIQASTQFAETVLHELGQITTLHGNHIQKAGFMVLKAPDIPSILVETGFISNPYEEKRLNTAKHQNKLANAILKGVKYYFKSEKVYLSELENRTY